MTSVREYFERLKNGLDRVDVQTVEDIARLLRAAREEGKRIFIFGNGGSSATASHFVNDLNKYASENRSRRFKAISLNDSVPLVTAWANDVDYSEIFVRQLENFLEPGDMVIAISASGNSINVVKAVEFAQSRGAVGIAFVGFNGGRLKQVADYCVHFEEPHYGLAEDAHLIFCHVLVHRLCSAGEQRD